ncbi:MAG TPA: hypothetical protein VGM29_13360, partial [Polyangiaceae bacterium]
MILGSPRRSLAVLAVLGCMLAAAWLFAARGRLRIAPTARADSLEADEIRRARERLHAYEEQRRSKTDFASIPPANLTHGADPYALARLDAEHLVGVLRGASKLVVLDRRLHELARADSPLSGASVVVADDGEIDVAGEGSPRIFRFRFDGGALTRLADWLVPAVVGVRALALGPRGTVYVLDVRDGELLTLRARAGHELLEGGRRFAGHGPIALRRVESSLLVNLLLDHALVIYDLDERGEISSERARIVHDGPIWGFDVAPFGRSLVVAAGGVENHPLERRDGSFGFIDSFAFTYLVSPDGGLELVREDNLSALSVVTPKAVSLSLDSAGHADLFVSGYGSARAATLSFDLQGGRALEVRSENMLPGTAQVLALGDGSLAFSDPLLDAWVLRETTDRVPTAQLVPVRDDAAPASSNEELLGEALFFTTLMAPHNSSEGRASRFTCETCHFEGEIDGRIHNTGRGDVRVATKPLRGLFNNRPHFSRAFDRDLTTVVFNEFRVAGKGSGTDPWFSVRQSEFPWLTELGVQDAEVGPEALRHALLTFLMGFSHLQNPSALGRSAFTADERRGAEVFRDACTRCHAARLSTDDEASTVPFERWE